jgi:hypothetical protein
LPVGRLGQIISASLGEEYVDVKQAVALAKQHILDVFADEKVSNLGLEEVEFDDQSKNWLVTLGFSRPWDEPRNAFAALAHDAYARRTYKVVRISDALSSVLAIKTHEEKA